MTKSFEQIKSSVIDLDDAAYEDGQNGGFIERWSTLRKESMKELLGEVKELCEENERLKAKVELLEPSAILQAIRSGNTKKIEGLPGQVACRSCAKWVHPGDCEHVPKGVE